MRKPPHRDSKQPLGAIGLPGLCVELSPVSCRRVAALGVGRRALPWRLGCELPALLPDGENTFPVPLPASPHIPDSPDSRRIAAPQRAPLQVLHFNG